MKGIKRFEIENRHQQKQTNILKTYIVYLGFIHTYHRIVIVQNT